MSKMETLANMFDVKIGEEFWLIDEKGNNKYKCRFTENALERHLGGEWVRSVSLLGQLLQDDFTVEPVVWRPKVGEYYRTYCRYDWAVCKVKCLNTFESALKIASSVAFRTKEEAYSNRAAAYEIITGKKWEGVVHELHGENC